MQIPLQCHHLNGPLLRRIIFQLYKKQSTSHRLFHIPPKPSILPELQQKYINEDFEVQNRKQIYQIKVDKKEKDINNR